MSKCTLYCTLLVCLVWIFYGMCSNVADPKISLTGYDFSNRQDPYQQQKNKYIWAQTFVPFYFLVVKLTQTLVSFKYISAVSDPDPATPDSIIIFLGGGGWDRITCFCLSIYNFLILCASVDAMTRLNCLRVGGFFAGDFCGIFSAYIWRIFLSSFLSHISTFSLILNGFNIGQGFNHNGTGSRDFWLLFLLKKLYLGPT